MPGRPNNRIFILVASVLILVAAGLVAGAGDDAKLSISCDRDSHRPGDSVSIYVQLKSSNLTTENISLEIDYPDGSAFMVWTNATNSTGVTSFSFKLPKDTPIGTYHLTATCNLNKTSLQAQSSFRVDPKIKPPPDNILQSPVILPIAGTAVVGLIAVGLAIGATEAGKYGFITLFIPLFTRLNKDEALDNKVRHQILGYLTENPGQHYNALKKALGITNGGMTYHLLVLEREGFIHSQRDGLLKRFYPASIKLPETRKSTPEEIVLAIIATIEKHPDITQKELVERLVVNDDTVGHHLRKLVRESKIISWKKGKTRMYRPVPKKNYPL